MSRWIQKLSDLAVSETLKEIFDNLHDLDDCSDQKREILQAIVDRLEELDADDALGFEGWRHLFGMEDCGID